MLLSKNEWKCLIFKVKKMQYFATVHARLLFALQY